MRGIFCVPSHSHNLIKLVRKFDQKPIVYCWQGHWDEEDSASAVEWLVEQGDSSLGDELFREWVQGNFQLSYRPSFVRQGIVKDGVDTGDEVVQPLDWKSILFFLVDWETSTPAIIFSGESDPKTVATALAAHYRYRPKDQTPEFSVRNDPRKYPSELVSDFTACSRYVIFTGTLYGTVIVSHDDVLLQSMFDYLLSLGELGFVYDGTTESQQKRRQMARGQWEGLYLDEIPIGFARRWDENHNIQL